MTRHVEVAFVASQLMQLLTVQRPLVGDVVASLVANLRKPLGLKPGFQICVRPVAGEM